MLNPRATAASLLGPIDWQSEVSGWCKCPGQSLHTKKDGKRDCRVNIDGAPTIHCFHSSCTAAVAHANRDLRQALNAEDWSLKLPSGRTVRSGDILHASGEITPREVVAQHPEAAREENAIRATLRENCQRLLPDILAEFDWPFDRIIADSPLTVHDRDAAWQFRTWLSIWPDDSNIWIGNITDSGKPRFAANWKTKADWLKGRPIGNFTCGSSFKPDTHSRSNENIQGHRFLVVESDTHSRDQVGAIFAYLHRRLHFHLHCIIDTAGKSLHGWFDAPPAGSNKEKRLRIALEALGCDPKVFTYSQPVRCPGSHRDNDPARLQRLIWLTDQNDTSPRDQLDVAADLGATPSDLPEIVTVEELFTDPPPTPPILVDNLLHQGCKMILGGTSKSNKTWCLLDLAVSLASGQPWWNMATPTMRSDVIYLNFELHPWSIKARIESIAAARPNCTNFAKHFHLWNLRGHNADLTRLRPRLEAKLAAGRFAMVILDPAYKLMGNRDENSNSEIADLMNEFERLAQSAQAALVISHHFAKGDYSAKHSIDRISGAGAWARDPDTLLILSPNETEDAFSVEATLRNLPQLNPFAVRWEFPLMIPDDSVDPAAVKKPKATTKICQDETFLATIFPADNPDQAIGFKAISQEALYKLSIRSTTTVNAYLNRLTKSGHLTNTGGIYSRPKHYD